MLRDSRNEAVDQRETIHVFVSNLLLQANAYRGFNYLTEAPRAARPTRSASCSMKPPARAHKLPGPHPYLFLLDQEVTP